MSIAYQRGRIAATISATWKLRRIRRDAQNAISAEMAMPQAMYLGSPTEITHTVFSTCKIAGDKTAREAISGMALFLIIGANVKATHPLPEGELCYQVKVHNFHLNFDSERVVDWCAPPCSAEVFFES